MGQEIIDKLKSIEIFYITNVYNLLNNQKYKLQKNKNITYKVVETPKIKQGESQEVTYNFKKQYVEVVDNFVSTLREKLPSDSLAAMEHNLQTLRINNTSNPIFCHLFNGMYNLNSNCIILGKQNRGVATITHELLHMSSGRKIITGFNNGFVGRYLNEGYTEILNNRLFGHPITSNPQYNICSRFASIVEDIIGKDQMTNLYFNANLKGLFEQLSSYSSNTKTSVFLRDLDALMPLGGRIGVVNVRCLDRITNYLVDTSINYINASVKDGTLSSEEGKLFLQNFKDKMVDLNTYLNKLAGNDHTLSLTDNVLDTISYNAEDGIYTNKKK